MVIPTSSTPRPGEGLLGGPLLQQLPGRPMPDQQRSDQPRSDRLDPVPRQRTLEDLLLAVEVVDAGTGVRHRRVVVVDASDSSPTRNTTQQTMAAYDAALRTHPEWPAPQVANGRVLVRNPASEWFYGSPALREWRALLVPTAAALYPMQRPESERLPSGGLIDSVSRAVFRDCLDSVGIRTRARLLGHAVHAAWQRTHGAGSRSLWVSLACGAAVPVLDVLRDLSHHSAEPPFLELVDLDEQALAFAGRLARRRGLLEGQDYRLLRRNLVSGIVARTSLLDELGEGRATVVDAVGIFEYFRDAACVKLLRNAYELLAPGGVLVVANMLADRPQLAFNQRAAGWPSIFPRTLEGLVDLVRAAGLPLNHTTVSVAQDGVYAVVDVVR